MSKLFPILLVILWLAVSAFSQTQIESCMTGPEDRDVVKFPGTEATLCWFMIYDPNILFFRIYRSQTQAGAWDVWKKVPYDEATMRIVNTWKNCCDNTEHTLDRIVGYYKFPVETSVRRYRIVAVIAIVIDGVTTMKETVSTSEVKITPGVPIQ